MMMMLIIIIIITVVIVFVIIKMRLQLPTVWMINICLLPSVEFPFPPSPTLFPLWGVLSFYDLTLDLFSASL